MLNNGPDSDLAASLQDANPPDSTARQCNAVHEIVVTAGHNPAEPSISDGRTDGRAGRQADRQTDRQTDRDLLRIRAVMRMSNVSAAVCCCPGHTHSQTA